MRSSYSVLSKSAASSLVVMVLGMITLTDTLLAQSEKEGQGQAIVTILPKHDGAAVNDVPQADLKLKVNGKDATVENWVSLKGDQNSLELIVLIDGSARTSLGRQLEDLQHFIQSQPPNVKMTIGYMENGRAALVGPLTTDHAQVLRGLHIPGGSAGSNASPYFCLSDLAKSWPSGDRSARREVVMVTDGVDNYNRRFDPEDVYVQTAIADSVRAGLVVYSIYWRDQGRADNGQYADSSGQNLLTLVTESTGGRNFWQGLGNPVSFQPFLEELSRRLRNQYELNFVVSMKGKSEVENMKLKFSAPGAEISAPTQVFVTKAGVAQN